MSDTKPIPYSEDVRPQDTEKAMETVKILLFPNDDKPVAIDFNGACPRCGHSIQSREWLVAMAGVLKLNDSQKQAAIAHLGETGVDLSHGDYTFDLTCSCSETHPHRPKDKQGCGSRFRVRVKWP